LMYFAQKARNYEKKVDELIKENYKLKKMLKEKRYERCER